MKPRLAYENEEVFRVCAHCHEAIQTISAHDEYWDYCEGCEMVEGGTCYINDKGEVVDV